MKRIALALALVSAASVPARAQEVKWKPRPSFRVGDDALRLDPRVKLQGSFRWFPRELEPADGTFAMGLRRLGVEGMLFKHVEFEVERDFNGGGAWTDVYVAFQRFRGARVQAGKFKMPFSLDELTGATSLDFVNRTMIGRDLAPGREIGVMLQGRVLDGSAGLSYETGVFRHDGERSRFLENPGAGTTFAGRVRVQPLRSMQKDAPLRNLEVGLATTLSDVPEGPGPNSLRARSVAGFPLVYEVYVKGRRTRLGAEASWEPGPFSVKSEFIQIWDERREQGLLGDDLPRLGLGGWYVSGTWNVTGERKAGGVEPRRPLLDGGFGALELAARYERLRFGADDPAEPPEANPRANNLVETGNGAWTLGANWHVNRWSRIQFNAIRESFDDIERSPVSGRSSYWSGMCRLQFVL
jgi:phosphate-selective porin OprO/OprP